MCGHVAPFQPSKPISVAEIGPANGAKLLLGGVVEKKKNEGHLWFGQPAAGPATHIGKSCYVPSREVIGT
jgi:hypothetical protein